MKHIFLISLLLASPFTIKTMDQSTQNTISGIIVHREQLQLLFSKTFHMLCDLRLDKNSQFDVENLVSVINHVDVLKNAQTPVTEKEIGFSIYKKKLTPELTDYFKRSPFQTTINPTLASLFFVCLEHYNTNIKQKKLTSPNAQQMANYLNELRIKDLATKASKHNIIIPQSTLSEVTIPTPSAIATQDFKQLMDNINGIFSYSIDDFEGIAKLAYHDELKKASAR